MVNSDSMRAAAIDRFGPPELLSLRELPLPPVAAGQVRIRIAATTVNPADLGMVTGSYRWSDPVRFPLIPGYDVAGIVDAIGDGVTDFAVGDRVIACTQHALTQAGSYAEYVALPAPYVAPAPAGIELTAAATLPLAGLTAMQALEHLSLTPGQTLLINGPLGAVGGFALQLAAWRGITILAPAFARDADRALALGATHILKREKDLLTQLRQVAPSGVDAALDVVGGAVAMSAFTAVREGGRYVTIVPEFWVPGGQFTPARGITPSIVSVRATTPELTRQLSLRLRELSRLLATGQLTARIAEILKLEHVRAAYRMLADGHVSGKIVLTP